MNCDHFSYISLAQPSMSALMFGKLVQLVCIFTHHLIKFLYLLKKQVSDSVLYLKIKLRKH